MVRRSWFAGTGTSATHGDLGASAAKSVSYGALPRLAQAETGAVSAKFRGWAPERRPRAHRHLGAVRPCARGRPDSIRARVVDRSTVQKIRKNEMLPRNVAASSVAPARPPFREKMRQALDPIFQQRFREYADARTMRVLGIDANALAFSPTGHDPRRSVA